MPPISHYLLLMPSNLSAIERLIWARQPGNLLLCRHAGAFQFLGITWPQSTVAPATRRVRLAARTDIFCRALRESISLNDARPLHPGSHCIFDNSNLVHVCVCVPALVCFPACALGLFRFKKYMSSQSHWSSSSVSHRGQLSQAALKSLSSGDVACFLTIMRHVSWNIFWLALINVLLNTFMCQAVFDDATIFNKKLVTCEKRINQLKAATDGAFTVTCVHVFIKKCLPHCDLVDYSCLHQRISTSLHF